MRVRTGRFEELRFPCIRFVLSRAVGFIASQIKHGFTLPFAGPPRVRGHLMQCLPHRQKSKTSPRSALRSRFYHSLSGRRRRPLKGSPPSAAQTDALLPCTTAGFTPPPLGHKSFAVCCPLALVGTASYPVLIHRPAVSIHASSPWSVTLPQLRFSSLAMTSSRWDLHPQECAHAGRTTKSPAFGGARCRLCRQLAFGGATVGFPPGL
jgi:hypothetical protein